jgi:hypothetical protein
MSHARQLEEQHDSQNNQAFWRVLMANAYYTFANKTR